jgi:hypothetical protein
VADDPAGQPGRDRAGRPLAVRGHLGGQAEEFPSGLISAVGGCGVTRDEDDRVAEPADEAAAWLDTYARRHLFHCSMALSLFAMASGPGRR